MSQTTRPYTIVILLKTPKINETGSDKIIWEHARRNYELRREDKLCIVCPIRDDTKTAGLYIFSSNVEETTRIMNGDPGVTAGIFAYEIHPGRSFPGDTLH